MTETVWVVVDRDGERRGMPQVVEAAAVTLCALRNKDDQAGAPFTVIAAVLTYPAWQAWTDDEKLAWALELVTGRGLDVGSGTGLSYPTWDPISESARRARLPG